jgi:hypothetical protein
MKHLFTTLVLAMAGTSLMAQTTKPAAGGDDLQRSLEFPCCFSLAADPARYADALQCGLSAPKVKNGNQGGNAGQQGGGAPSAAPKTPLYNDKNAMMKVSQQEGKYYLEIADSIVGRLILATTRFTSVPGGIGKYSGEQVSTYTLYFEKNAINNTLLLRSTQNYMKADTLDAIYKAVSASNTDPIVGAFKIEECKNGVNKINASDLLLNDNFLSLPASYKSMLQLTNLNPMTSYIESVHTYPLNVELRTVRTYNRAQRTATPTFTFGLNTSFYLLPAEPMRPRLSDPRVGYFYDGYYKYSDNQQQVETNLYVCRRRLEPKSEEDAKRQQQGELIEPKQQIVYYIDPATPKQWRPYLIQGVKDWNAAFEQAGWKNAITAMEWPENDSTMSMEDSRYSVIMYLASNIANAYGPQNHDPRSGEILECHIGWYHNVMSLVHDWYQIQCGALDPAARNAVFSDELMGELVRFVSSHEVGHTLGLCHNFGASATVPVDSLRSNSYLAQHGFCPSIMDYARFNYVAQPEDGIELKNLQPRINEYDKWAIEWGYRLMPDATDAESDRYLLNKITTERTSQNPKLLWYDGESYTSDPRFQTEDLGDDAVKANTLGIENLKRIAPELRKWNYWGGDNTDSKLTNMYGRLTNQFTRYCNHVIKNLGGPCRTPLAPEQDGDVYTYPAKEKAAAVVPFLKEQLFTRPSWLVDVPYAGRLFSDSEAQLERIAGPLVSAATSGSRIASINPNYGAAQYLEDLNKAIFGNFNTAAQTDRYTRYVQNIYVHNLCEAYKANATSLSNDASAAIYSNLRTIEKKLSNAASADAATQAHYRQMLTDIQRALVIK